MLTLGVLQNDVIFVYIKLCNLKGVPIINVIKHARVK